MLASMSTLEAQIHSRYLAAEETNNSLEARSERLLRLISSNNTVGLLDFLQSIPYAQRVPLLNRKMGKLDMTPVNFAIRCSAHHLILIGLLRSGAVFANGLVSPQGDHPLLQAVRSGNVNYVKILLAVNGNVNVLDGDGYSLLHWACFRGNALLVRIILQAEEFCYHNHDRNRRKISPLGIAIDSGKPELVRELCKCPKIDVNLIDTHSKRFLYDLAAEKGFHFACFEMERAFRGGTSKQFHMNHEYQVELAIQHQIRSVWFNFVNDPRGAFEIAGERKQELDLHEWKVYQSPEMQDSSDAWIQSFLTDESGRALAVNWNFERIIPGPALFDTIDNYRFRYLTRVTRLKE